jgi:hypothetical protein
MHHRAEIGRFGFYQGRNWVLAVMVVMLLSACDWWPRDLAPLAESIRQEVSGDTEAWLVGGDIAVINVSGSPVFEQPGPELEALAMSIAKQTIDFVVAPLEAVTVTFYRNAMTDDGEDMAEFIFLVEDGAAVRPWAMDPDVSGPLTDVELESSIDRFDEAYDGPEGTWTPQKRDCVLAEAKARAAAAGDPESLNPATLPSLEGVSPLTWNALDDFGRRLLLVQVITTEALFACVGRGN